MWSLACVCAEMYLGLPLFPGVSQHNQLTRIVEMMGNPPDALIEGKNGGKYFTKTSPSLSALLHSHNFHGQVVPSFPASLHSFRLPDQNAHFSPYLFVSFHIHVIFFLFLFSADVRSKSQYQKLLTYTPR